MCLDITHWLIVFVFTLVIEVPVIRVTYFYVPLTCKQSCIIYVLQTTIIVNDTGHDH